MMALRRLLHVVASDVLVLALVVFPPPVVAIHVVLEWVEAARVLAPPLDVVALCPALALRLISRHELAGQVGDVWIYARMVLIAEQPLDVVAVLEAILGLLVQFRILGAHAR